METILSVKNLATHFMSDKTVYAVNNASFELKTGEVLGLVGESGCGKSVLCKSILKIVKRPGKIVNGSINYKGTDLVSLSEKEMQAIRGSEIAMIFQEPMTALNPVLTIREQLYEALKQPKLPNSKKQELVIDLLKKVGIPSPDKRLDEYPHQFSGGMRQRVMIAAGIAANPKILLADEPTTALDVTIQKQIIDLILDLKDQLGMSIVMVTHDLGVVAEMCDRVVVMYAGHVMEMADSITLFSRPRHPYTIGLMKSIPNNMGKGEKLQPISGNPPDLSVKITGCPFVPRCTMADEKCKNSLPELFSVEENHFSACFKVSELKGISGLIEEERDE